MAITLTVDFPPDVEQRLRAESDDLSADVKEAFAVQLFRLGKLNHYQLSHVLVLDRFQTDALLKRHRVTEGSLTLEDVEADRRTLVTLLAKSGS